MIKRHRDETAALPLPEILPTREVFIRNAPVYLRFSDRSSQQKMVLVNCLGLQGNSTILSLQWSNAAAQVANPPALGLRIQCYTIVAGVLYTVTGRISGQVNGPQLRLDIVVEDSCHGINLRRHARFHARGTLTLQPPGAPGEPQLYFPRGLDLSQGGLGVALPDAGWQVGDVLEFTLVFIPEQLPGSQLEFSELDIAGKLVVRKRTILAEYGHVRLGCEFTHLPELDERLLRLLISTHGAALRTTD